MKTNIEMNNTLTKLSEFKNNSTFQVLEYDDLRGGSDVKTAFMLSPCFLLTVRARCIIRRAWLER